MKFYIITEALSHNCECCGYVEDYNVQLLLDGDVIALSGMKAVLKASYPEAGVEEIGWS